MYPGWLPLLGGQSVPEGSRCCILNRPDAGKTFWPGIVCTVAPYWPYAGITLYAVTTPLCARYT